MRSGKLNSNASSIARVGAMRVAAARAIAASSPVVPHTPQLEPAEKRRVAVCISMRTSGRRRTLTTLGRRVLDSTASISLTWLTMPSPYNNPTARFSSSPGVLMVVPNDTGSSPSAGWCSMYSSGASTATRSSLSRCESRPARTMLTFIVPPATGGEVPGAMNSALLTGSMIPLFPSTGCETVQKQCVRICVCGANDAVRGYSCLNFCHACLGPRSTRWLRFSTFSPTTSCATASMSSASSSKKSFPP